MSRDYLREAEREVELIAPSDDPPPSLKMESRSLDNPAAIDRARRILAEKDREEKQRLREKTHDYIAFNLTCKAHVCAHCGETFQRVPFPWIDLTQDLWMDHVANFLISAVFGLGVGALLHRVWISLVVSLLVVKRILDRVMTPYIERYICDGCGRWYRYVRYDSAFEGEWTHQCCFDE